MKTKNIVKRMAVALILVCLLATSAAALDQSGPVVVEPRYVGVSYNVVGLSIDPDGWSTSYGHVKTYDGYDVDIEVTSSKS